MIEEKYIKILSEIGFDLNDRSHPLGKEYYDITRKNDEMLNQCIDHILMILILDLLIIKKHKPDDYKYYRDKLKIKDISFWGERFEIYFYARLIQKSIENNFKVRRSESYNEADFVIEINGEITNIESTSLKYSVGTSKSDPIRKIKNKITEKERISYAQIKTCLVIDVTNLIFYRSLLNNFSKSISQFIEDLPTSKFGAILFHETYHAINNNQPHFYSNAYVWKNTDISESIYTLLQTILGEPVPLPHEKIQFRIS